MTPNQRACLKHVRTIIDRIASMHVDSFGEANVRQLKGLTAQALTELADVVESLASEAP